MGEGSWCFRGTGRTDLLAGRVDLFVRLIKNPPAEERLYAIQFLYTKGIPVIPILSNRLGSGITPIENCGIVVSPFMGGTTLMKGAFPQAELPFFRKKIGGIVSQLHQISPADGARFSLPVEDFSKFQAESMKLLWMIDQPHSDPLLKEFTLFLNRWRNGIECVITEAQKWTEYLRSQQFDYVLCHGDIHEDNMFITDEGEPCIIDWDEMMLAPRERDVMFFSGDGLNDYLEGYRRHAPGYCINQGLVDYYVLEWALQEIVDYGTRILADAHFDLSGRLDAWQQFQQLFEPGGDVETAFRLIKRP